MDARVAALEALFRAIAATRMQGIALLNPRLAVQAVGFERAEDGSLQGILVTPWFMNLVRLPGDGESAAVAGAGRVVAIGAERFEFIGAHEPGFGAYEVCSLFSPMAEFEDQEAALATASQVLAILRQPPPRPPLAAAPAAPMPSRRALLFGRAGGAR